MKKIVGAKTLNVYNFLQLFITFYNFLQLLTTFYNAFYPSITSGLPLHISHFAFKSPLYCRVCWITPKAVVVTIYKPIALAFHRTKATIINTKKIFIYFIIPLISGIHGVSIPGIFGTCVGHLMSVINDICAYISNPASAEITRLPPVRRSIPKNVVWIWWISTLRNCKKLYTSAGLFPAAISLTVQ